jgi:hypothetical protein
MGKIATIRPFVEWLYGKNVNQWVIIGEAGRQWDKLDSLIRWAMSNGYKYLCFEDNPNNTMELKSPFISMGVAEVNALRMITGTLSFHGPEWSNYIPLHITDCRNNLDEAIGAARKLRRQFNW